MMSGTPQRGTILLAEDEALLRELQETILRQAGYTVVSAPTPEELRALITNQNNHGFDLLLTDVVMPGISGQEVAALAKSRWPHIRVIFMSGYSDQDLEDLDRDAAFLQKPFTPAELMAKVRELIGN
jgi:two-component system, cell cycle sensor histidine kinase and response regulator CckA